MKLILTLVFFMTTQFPQQSNLSEVRNLYKAAASSEKAAEKLLKMTAEEKTKNPLMMGYHGVAQMMMAKHVGNPFKKLGYFNKGKDFFSVAIEADPDNVELRFLRFTVQAETPGFLNYKQNLREDKNILLGRVQTQKDEELREMIKSYLLSSKEVSASEKDALKN